MSWIVSLSKKYLKYEEPHFTLFVRGEVFSVGSTQFEGPHDPRVLETLVSHLKDDPLNAWEQTQGSFTAVLQFKDRLFLYRSPFSPHLLFWSSEGVSDDLRIFHRMSHNFSSAYFQSFVLDFPSLQFNSPLTPLNDISRLAPHSRVSFSKGSAPETKWFAFQPYILPESSWSPTESATAVRTTLETVLKWHLDKKAPIHVELSGGLDSSFVASFLADLSAEPIEAHMYAFKQNPSHAFSENCAREVAANKKIALQVFDSQSLVTTDLSKPAPFQNEPVDFFWQGALFGRLCQSFLRKKALLFTGFGADQIFMRNQNIISAVFQKSGFGSGLPWVRSIAESLNRPALNFYYQYVLSCLPEKFLLSLLKSTHHWRINPFKVDELKPHFLQNELIRWIKSPVDLLDLQKTGQLLEERFFEPYYPHAPMNYFVAPGYVLGPYLEEVGVEYIHPFCDPRMLDLVHKQIPFEHIHDFKNPYKNILRLAMTGIVPETVRTRRRDEFSFDGYFFSLFNFNRDFLESLLDDTLKDHQDWIDKHLVRKSFQLLFFGGSSNSEVKLTRLLAYSYWKRNFLDSSAQSGRHEP